MPNARKPAVGADRDAFAGRALSRSALPLAQAQDVSIAPGTAARKVRREVILL